MIALILSWAVTLFIGIITLILVRQYVVIRKLPPGPLPLPFLGNLLRFRSNTSIEVFNHYRKQFGNIFTVWLGSVPFVVLTDLPEIKEAMLDRRSDFAGRATLRSTEIFLDGCTSIADSDFSPVTETLRKMAIAAIRKYTVSEHLPPLVEIITKETVDSMLREKAPFDPQIHVHHLLSSYIASSIFGKRFERNDPEFLAFKNVADTLNEEFGKGFMGDFIPFLRYFYKSSEENIRKATRIAIPMVREKLRHHMATYEPGLERDMIDSLLAARDETIAEGKESAAHMNDQNLTYAIYDLYFASIETSTMTITWTLLFLATYPNIQEKVIQEIGDVIGDRLAVQDDRKLCHFTNALIHEILRLRGPAPFLLPRKAVRDSQIAGYKISKGTNIIVYANMVHNNPTYWKEPESFNPERFLEEDKSFTESRLSQHLPFGKGRRSCVGQKLAIVQIFLVLAGFFKNCRIKLKEAPKDLNPDENFGIFFKSKNYKIMAEPLS